MYCFPPLENCFPEPSQQRLHRAFVVNQVCTCAMCFFLLALFWEQGMMVYYHADRLVRAVSYVRRGDLVSSEMRERAREMGSRMDLLRTEY